MTAISWVATVTRPTWRWHRTEPIVRILMAPTDPLGNPIDWAP